VYAYWKNGFKRLRLFLVHRVLSALEVECNAAANTLGLAGWNISLVSATETKSETTKLGVQIQVASPQSKEFVPWESWSGGEAQRLKLAIALGVARLIQRAAGVHWTLEVYDEPTQHLSPSGVEKLMESLDYRADATQKRIFVVDHTALTYSNFKAIYRAVKTAECGTIFS
jgi:DNA repair exonuclease SbcCD ATPase subunit